ncbi:MAG: class I SAM-dependent methyltransferase [Acidobacteria bacterium]|nr:MAG: class I SAM-dependent methyltransferase [Acidobacteriota bacterium]
MLPAETRLASELRAILRCIACRSGLREEQEGYTCLNCGRGYPLVRNSIRFVDACNYAQSFGFQWERYSRTQLDTAQRHVSEGNFRRRTGFSPEELRGKLVLDVGCGMGRYAEVATRWGARVVGVDLSVASEVAGRNLAQREFVALQADVFDLPFAPESFDLIYSIGVLHHTPDCEKAVKVLPTLLKPGGSIAIWLYSAYNKWYRFSDLYRKFTSRISAQTLHTALRIAVPSLYWLDCRLRSVPLLGPPLAGAVHHVFPVSLHQDKQVRVLDTFDWYSPKYQSKHTYEEVFRWFKHCGLVDLRVIETPIAVRGRKPVTSPETLTMENPVSESSVSGGSE